MSSLRISLIISIVFSLVLGQSAFALLKTRTTTGNSLSFLGGNKVVNSNQTIITNNTIPLQSVTYIEDSVSIINQIKQDSRAGLVWTDGNKSYYAFLFPSSSLISLYSRGHLLHTKIDPHIVKDALYTIRIVFSRNAIDVFLNNTPAIHEQVAPHNVILSNVGIETFNSVAEFEPVKIVGTPFSNLCSFPHIGCLLQNLFS